jgi:hypothetical protein
MQLACSTGAPVRRDEAEPPNAPPTAPSVPSCPCFAASVPHMPNVLPGDRHECPKPAPFQLQARVADQSAVQGAREVVAGLPRADRGAQDVVQARDAGAAAAVVGGSDLCRPGNDSSTNVCRHIGLPRLGGLHPLHVEGRARQRRRQLPLASVRYRDRRSSTTQSAATPTSTSMSRATTLAQTTSSLA